MSNLAAWFSFKCGRAEYHPIVRACALNLSHRPHLQRTTSAKSGPRFHRSFATCARYKEVVKGVEISWPGVHKCTDKSGFGCKSLRRIASQKREICFGAFDTPIDANTALKKARELREAEYERNQARTRKAAATRKAKKQALQELHPSLVGDPEVTKQQSAAPRRKSDMKCGCGSGNMEQVPGDMKRQAI